MEKETNESGRKETIHALFSQIKSSSDLQEEKNNELVSHFSAEDIKQLHKTIPTPFLASFGFVLSWASFL